ncbi:MAG: hypothetical protein ACXVB9_16500 [Bdellovibrionota bacterium]
MFNYEALLADNILNVKPLVPILVIEDDRALLPIFDWIIHSVNPSLAFHWCASLEEARDHLRKNRYKLILSDFLLEGKGNGLDIWELNGASAKPAEFAMMSTLKLEEFCKTGDHAPRYLAKPLDVGAVQTLIRRAVNQPEAL